MSRKGDRHRVKRSSTFWDRVDKSGDCWLWLGGKSSNGYGETRTGTAHRQAYADAYGPIPEGQWVLHHCDVKLCVRPDHLYLGGVTENTRDAVTRGRFAKGESSGHAKVTEADVLAIRRLAAAGAMQKDLAAQFGLSKTAVHHIVRGHTWAYLVAEPGPMTLGLTA